MLGLFYFERRYNIGTTFSNEPSKPILAFKTPFLYFWDVESISKQPFEFFEDLLTNNKLTFLKDKFISDFVEHSNYLKIESIDKEKGIVKYWDIFYDEIKDDSIEALTSASFEKDFNRRINVEFRKSKEFIDEVITEITLNGKNPSEYILLNRDILKMLEKKTQIHYPDNPIVANAITALSRHLIEKYGAMPPTQSNQDRIPTIQNGNPDDYSPNSFLWDSLDNEQRLENLNLLYNKLTVMPKIIECTEDEFISAFSQKTVANGIRWCIKGKNGHVSKPSLIYFIDHLNKEGYINEIPSEELNKKIQYVFRDFNGHPLKNMRQSKYSSSLFPSGKDRLDDIFSEL